MWPTLDRSTDFELLSKLTELKAQFDELKTSYILSEPVHVNLDRGEDLHP